MRPPIVFLFLVLARVNSQCLTQNDDLPPPPRPDLSPTMPFSINLLKEVFPPLGNFIFSPYSIWTALVLAYFGANGNTQTEMEEVLRLGSEGEAFALYKALNRGPQPNNANYTLITANKIYVKEGVPFRDCLQKVFFEEMQSLDFRQADAAANTVNGFVNSTTRGKIKEIVKPSLFTKSVMLLVNAIFFKGLWSQQFNADDTTRQQFFTTPGQSSPVDMMGQRADFRHAMSTELDAQILEMPYRGGGASMFVLLPRDRNTGTELDEMIQRLNATTLKSAMDKLFMGNVFLQIPKFKFEASLGNELKQSLHRMGMRDVFTDFSDLSSFSSIDMKVTDIAHKAVVEVNEEGAEAAAATAVAIDIRIGPMKFICNRPFLFFIHDNEVNNMLFVGLYRKP